MLHFDRFTGKNEGVTVNIERAIAVNALQNGYNVVVDDCNLNPGNKDMWKQVAQEAGAEFKVEEMKTNVEECIVRDHVREKKVGSHVILGMALQYGLYPKPEKGIILCDLDGTLANVDHRLHFVKVAEGEKKDWKGFFDAIPLDTPRQDVIDIVMEYEGKGHPIFFVSARPDTYREATEAWLEKAFNGYTPNVTLIMRSSRDSRPDTEVKSDMYDKYFKDFPIEAVIDDRPSVIRMWREKGLNVIDVGAGVEF